MTPVGSKENNLSFAPQLIPCHHCELVLNIFLLSTFNPFQVQSILTGMCWKLHYLILYIVFSFYQEPVQIAIWLHVYNLHALWQNGNLMAVTIRLDLKYHPTRQRSRALSETSLTRAAAHAGIERIEHNANSKLLLLLHLRRRRNVIWRMLSVSAKQHSDARKGSPLLPLWQLAWGACPSQAVPMLRIILAVAAKHCAPSLCHGSHWGGVGTAGTPCYLALPGHFVNKQSDHTIRRVLFCMELNCS